MAFTYARNDNIDIKNGLVMMASVVFTLIWARIAAVFANKAPSKVINQATGVVLVILGVAVAAFRLFVQQRNPCGGFSAFYQMRSQRPERKSSTVTDPAALPPTTSLIALGYRLRNVDMPPCDLVVPLFTSMATVLD